VNDGDAAEYVGVCVSVQVQVQVDTGREHLIMQYLHRSAAE
jgi:hypothetical protein